MKQNMYRWAALLATLTCILTLLPLPANATSPTAGQTEYVTEDDKWVQNGDTWVYTFDVFDDTATFYLWEEYMDEYTSDAMSEPIVIDGSTDKVATITNTAQEEYGSLTVSKRVAGGEPVYDASSNVTGYTDPNNASFQFSLQLSGGKIGGTQVFGNVVFEDGVASFQLKNGESRTFDRIPAGTTYTVTETPDSRYTTASNGAEGEIHSAETAEADFINTVIPKDDTKVYQDVTLSKEVTGAYDTAGSYTFFVALSGLEPDVKYALSDGTEVQADKDGNVNQILTVAAGESIVFRQLPVGATYQFTEQEGDYTPAYTVTDANRAGRIASSGGSAEKGSALSTAEETVEAGEDVTVTFTNKLNRTERLTLRNEVLGEDPEQAPSFKFHILFTNMEPGTRINTTIGRFTADDDGVIEFDTFLRHGGEIVFNDLPVGTQYYIREEASQYRASYDQEDANDLGLIRTPAAANSIINASLATDDETVSEREDVTVTFHNIRTRPTASLTVSKTVAGNLADPNKAFAFTAVLTLDGEPLEGDFQCILTGDGLSYQRSLTADENGAVTFPSLTGSASRLKTCPWARSTPSPRRPAQATIRRDTTTTPAQCPRRGSKRCSRTPGTGWWSCRRDCGCSLCLRSSS